MSRHRKYPLQVVLDLYATGISQVEVGRRLGLHYTTVGYALQVAGIRKRKRPSIKRIEREKYRAEEAIRLQTRVARITRLYSEEKLSTQEIAAQLHMGRTTVYRILKSNGFNLMRPKGIKVRRDIRKQPQFFRAEPASKVERMLMLAAKQKGPGE